MNKRAQQRYLVQFAPVIITVAVIGVLSLFFVFSVRSFFDLQAQVASETADVDDLRIKTKIIQTNTDLTKSQIDTYNQLLTQLIPEQEDYFTILYALDTLSKKTNFNISRYSITLTDSVSNKIPLIIEGDGDSTTFLHFLQQYPYAGGRFITIEKLEYTPDVSGRIKVSLNFYNKKTNSATQPMSQFSAADIKEVQDIQAKTNIIIKNTAANIEYTKKQDPFRVTDQLVPTSTPTPTPSSAALVQPTTATSSAIARSTQ